MTELNQVVLAALVVALGGLWLCVFLYILEKGSWLHREPNRVLLSFEAALAGAVVLFGLWQLSEVLRRK